MLMSRTENNNNYEIFNPFDELRAKLWFEIVTISETHSDLWNHYFIELEKKDENIYNIFLQLLVSDAYMELVYLRVHNNLDEEEEELLETLEEKANWDEIKNDLETNVLSLHQLLYLFEQKQIHNTGNIISLTNYAYNHHINHLCKINSQVIYEMIYASLVGSIHKATYSKREFINIYSFLESKMEPEEIKEEYARLLKDIKITEPSIYSAIFKDMIKDFYVYASLNDSINKTDDEYSKEKEMFRIIEKCNYQQIANYFTHDQEAFEQLCECFYLHNEIYPKEDLLELMDIVKQNGYTKILKMLRQDNDKK